MIPMRSKVSSTLQPYSVTCQRRGKSRQPSFIQTCERSEIGPIIVTTWRRYEHGGLLESRGWKETQNVHPRQGLDVATVLSASLKEARAYFREGHIVDPHMQTYADEYEHELDDVYSLWYRYGYQ